MRFYQDLVKGKVVLINFMYATCTNSCPTFTANLVRVQRLFGDRVGRDVFMYSISLDPEHDSPQVLRDYAKNYSVQPGWTFLTGSLADITTLRRRLGLRDLDPVVDADKTQHIGVVLYGNERFDRWAACPALSEPREIVKYIGWVRWLPAGAGMNQDHLTSTHRSTRRTRSTMNIFTKFRRSRMQLIWVLVGVVVTSGAAVAQQICPIPPLPPGPLNPVAPGSGSLKGVQPPLPKALDTVIKNRQMAIVLGKAFFWDQQAGSDGNACASCHFHAGADNRTKNQLNPGLRAVPEDTTFKPTRTGGGGPNYLLKAADYPFHVLSNPLDRDSAILFDSTDITSSQGTFGGNFIEFRSQGQEECSLDPGSIFSVNGKQARNVEPRNSPTTINAIFQLRSFWDGRANNHFNGVNPFGRRDPNARILVRQADGSIVPEVMDLENAALASQAVGPPLSTLESSCANRTFNLIARKLLTHIPKPLFGQKVELDDSVLGPYADNGTGGTGSQGRRHVFLLDSGGVPRQVLARARLRLR